jgi:hypothetical protein
LEWFWDFLAMVKGRGRDLREGQKKGNGEGGVN